jgi:hypothetical protein
MRKKQVEYWWKRLGGVLATVFLSLGGNDASAQTRRDFQSWFQTTALIKLTSQEPKFSLYLEAQPRFGDNSSSLERLLLRPALVYHVTPALSLWAGYAWTPTYLTPTYQDDFRNESRAWEQMQYTQKLEDTSITLVHRLRQEQRFLQNAGGTSHRTRYLLRASAPWCPEGAHGLTGYNEAFVTWNGPENAPRKGFDRDRVFVGPYWTIAPGMRLEVGYLGEYARHFRDGQRLIQGVLTSLQMNF